jgi:hypothetical protein
MTVGSQTVGNWSIKAELNGEKNGWHQIGHDQSWNKSTQFPIDLKPGSTLWFSTTFDYSSLPVHPDFQASLSLRILGKNARATIYLNGYLIGRWISDDRFLQRGNWISVIRNLWTHYTPIDDFPLSDSRLVKGTNKLVITFEDVSDEHGVHPGVIETLLIRNSAEILKQTDQGVMFTDQVLEKIRL